jgi:hypothetical protein
MLFENTEINLSALAEVTVNKEKYWNSSKKTNIIN